MLTVDVPVAGARLRDVRNGFTIPPSLTVKTVLDASMHPAWWANLLTTRPLTFASLSSWGGTVADLLNQLFDPTMTIDDLNWLRSIWEGPLIIKGIQTVEDARRVVDAGADAIVLSNHGGRQLDRAPTPLRILPEVRKAIGTDAEIYLDTGIMSGADIVASLALGADACLVGRAYLYGLMAGGERGVAKAAQILTTEVRRTMALLGVDKVADLNPGHVRLP
jgi:L-lactate dehydrogenase (cytochrome)